MSLLIAEELKKTISKSALSGSIVQRYYYSRVPQNTQLPYVVYYILMDTYKGNDTGTKHSELKVQWNIFSGYSDYGNQCNDIIKEITDFYDTKANVVVSGSTLINVNRDFLIPAKWQDEVWQGTIQYSFTT